MVPTTKSGKTFWSRRMGADQCDRCQLRNDTRFVMTWDQVVGRAVW
jgi:hypothetical protein